MTRRMKDMLAGGALVLCCLVLMAVTTRPGYSVKDAFVVTCLVGATTFPTVNAKLLLIRVRSNATNGVWIGPVGGVAVGDGMEIDIGNGAIPATRVPVSKNANEMDCIRDGAGDVDLTVLVLR